MENDSQSILEAYVFEAVELLDNLDKLLLRCEKAGGFDPDGINEVFRIMHTLKGSSAMMSFNTLTSLSHRVEDLFNAVRQNGMPEGHGGELFDLAFQASDALRSMVELARAGSPPEQDTSSLEAGIGALLETLSPAGPSTAGSAPHPSAHSDAGDAKFPARVRIRFAEDEPMPGARAFLMLRSLEADCPGMRSEPEHPDTPEGSQLVAEQGLVLLFETGAGADRAAALAGKYPFARSVSRENDAPEKAKTVPAAGQNAGPEATAQTLISVRLTRLDELLNLTGELVVAQSALTPYVQEQGGQKFLYRLRRLTDELQDLVMSVRMMPVSSVFQRMQRVVRDMNHKLGLHVSLVLRGEDTEVDKSVLDAIGDPILHMVRNAVDHGIEPPEERIKVGKPADGTVTLSARNTGGDVMVSVSDDGRGIEREAVLARAKERGLLTKPEKSYTERDTFALLMLPGFSTNKAVTEYSGRGVGLDVVKNSVEALGGRVAIESTPGRGTTIRFTIPLTLAAINGIRLTAGGLPLIVPLLNVRHLFRTVPGQVVFDDEGHEIVLFNSHYFPFIRLRGLLCPGSGEQPHENGIVLLVETGGRAYCVLADSVEGEQQVVVKPLPALLKQYRTGELGISGCSVLGNGDIGLILDPAALASHMGI